jgi:hypothetical protein
MRLLAGPMLTVAALVAGPLYVRADNPSPPPPDLPTTVAGEGDSEAVATNTALEDAHKKVCKYLRAKYPDIEVKPTAEFLQRARIINRIQGPDRRGVTWTVSYRVELPTSRLVEELRELSRVPYMGQRHRQAALVLGGLVLALLVLAAYFRLDEATRGYFAGSLLAVAGALIALIGGAVWWLI